MRNAPDWLRHAIAMAKPRLPGHSWAIVRIYHGWTPGQAPIAGNNRGETRSSIPRDGECMYVYGFARGFRRILPLLDAIRDESCQDGRVSPLVGKVH